MNICEIDFSNVYQVVSPIGKKGGGRGGRSQQVSCNHGGKFTATKDNDIPIPYIYFFKNLSFISYVINVLLHVTNKNLKQFDVYCI